MRITLLSANRHKEPYPVYPLASAYLKSYLMDNLHNSEISVVDMNMLSTDDLRSYLISFKPHYVCISIRNVDGANSLDQRGFLPDYKEIVEHVRKTTDVPVIIGGAGFSIYPEVFMRELGADYGIVGEGESSLCALLKALDEGMPVNQIPRLYVKDSGLSVQELSYIESPHSLYEQNLVEYYWKESGMLNIQTKRGCPYNCIYCTYPIIDGRKVRCMDIDLIVETIAKAKRDFGASYWFFTDSVFNIKNSYNIELAEALIKSDLGVSWGAYFSPSNISDSEMALFKASGLTHIEFGTESFCDSTLEAYGKNFTFDSVLRTSELALKHNVYYSHFLILAGYGESRKELDITIENSKQLHHTVIFPYVGMRVYPNTLLHKYMLEANLLADGDDLMSPTYYVAPDFDLDYAKQQSEKTGKAWVFPDAPHDPLVDILKRKRNKKGPLWEYLRKP